MPEMPCVDLSNGGVLNQKEGDRGPAHSLGAQGGAHATAQASAIHGQGRLEVADLDLESFGGFRVGVHGRSRVRARASRWVPTQAVRCSGYLTRPW
jgi:hypothetical protein